MFCHVYYLHVWGWIPLADRLWSAVQSPKKVSSYSMLSVVDFGPKLSMSCSSASSSFMEEYFPPIFPTPRAAPNSYGSVIALSRNLSHLFPSPTCRFLTFSS